MSLYSLCNVLVFFFLFHFINIVWRCQFYFGLYLTGFTIIMDFWCYLGLWLRWKIYKSCVWCCGTALVHSCLRSSHLLILICFMRKHLICKDLKILLGNVNANIHPAELYFNTEQCLDTLSNFHSIKWICKPLLSLVFFLLVYLYRSSFPCIYPSTSVFPFLLYITPLFSDLWVCMNSFYTSTLELF